jgi:F-type H+-transporting ATPase subunit a
MSANSVDPWFKIVSPDLYKNTVEFLKTGYLYAMDETSALRAAETGASALSSSWLVSLLLIALALVARGSFGSTLKKEGHKKYYAKKSFSILVVFEVYVEFIRNLSDSLIGRENTKKFFWLFGGIFLYILANNLLGLLPGAVSPSQSISNNFAIATVVLVFFTVIGFARQGFGFLKHMMGPVWYLAPLIFVIELFSTFIVRPGSLSLRLAGNMNGDHAVLGVTYDFYSYILPTIALGLGTFVSFVQAFVFTLLTIIYVVFSLGHDDHN